MFAAVCACMVACQESSPLKEKKKVAVYVTGGADDNINKVIGAKLVQAIVKNGKYSAVERTDAINAIQQKEQNRYGSGSIDDSRAEELGKELGVNFICVAEIVEAFGEKYISARLVDAGLMEAVEFADVKYDIKDMPSLVKMSEDVVARLFGEHVDALPSCNTSSSSSSKNDESGKVWSPDGIVMVYVAGDDAQDGFYIGKYEVTQAQWYSVMNDNPSHFAGCSDCPVENVSWDDIKTFISDLNSKTGRNYRLPTETEWVYAAKNGNSQGSCEYSGSDVIDEVAWYWDNSNEQTHQVGTKKPNLLGIYDMTGNVLEWCEDCHDSNCSSRVIRGGSWDYGASYCRTAFRDGYSPGYRGINLGFRLVLNE
ncbi:MAG: SUMF1/EgtB/PvdO family nonheme iron enzyme [Prevotellaceae bacterium]|nr:SUMF1/EgtB/PvdO family nonheme iron enzyme [Prevotellaceae bacterium]